MQIYGQWCILLGLLLFIFGYPLILLQTLENSICAQINSWGLKVDLKRWHIIKFNYINITDPSQTDTLSQIIKLENRH